MKSIFKVVLASSLLFVASVSQADATFQDTSGHSVQFSKLKGKWVILNYWASWCDSCVAEIPELNKFYNSHKGEVVFYGVNHDSMSKAQQLQTMNKLHIQYPVLLKNPAKELKLGYIVGIPATFIFNPEGKLVKKLYGEQTAKGLNKIIAAKSKK